MENSVSVCAVKVGRDGVIRIGGETGYCIISNTKTMCFDTSFRFFLDKPQWTIIFAIPHKSEENKVHQR